MSARRRRGKPQKRRQQQGRGAKPIRNEGAGFWGDASKLPPTYSDVRITDDPAAVVRSLGPPPLPGHETIAEHYFDAVYERAVSLAGALAAAGGLLAPEELAEELTD
jgi:hypothetical protein